MLNKASTPSARWEDNSKVGYEQVLRVMNFQFPKPMVNWTSWWSTGF